MNSPDQQALATSAKGVVNATVQLVTSAKKALALPEDDATDVATIFQLTFTAYRFLVLVLPMSLLVTVKLRCR